jgi:hypothetical protein
MPNNFTAAAGTISKLIAPTLSKNLAAGMGRFFRHPLTGIWKEVVGPL